MVRESGTTSTPKSETAETSLTVVPKIKANESKDNSDLEDTNLDVANDESGEKSDEKSDEKTGKKPKEESDKDFEDTKASSGKNDTGTGDSSGTGPDTIDTSNGSKTPKGTVNAWIAGATLLAGALGTGTFIYLKK